MTTLAVICKAPVPGLVKTRLCPPCTPEQAATLAAAALADTFDAVRATRCRRRVAVLDGEPGRWLGPGIDIVAQRGGPLDERLACAVADLGGPVVIIGMDTPQVTPILLDAALAATERHGSALGITTDGGYWVIGLARPDPAVIDGVPMSTAHTGTIQHARLVARGLRPARLPALVDVDDIETARLAARAAPAGRFAAALRAIDRTEVAA